MNNPYPTIRVGAIGCGGRLQTVLRLLLEQSPRISLVAGFDPYSPALDKIDEIAGAPVTRHTDPTSLIEDEQIDWIVIGSPNRFHAEQAVAALEAGKHVFCEKPLATDFESCLRVRDAVSRSDRHFVFGLVLRYSPHYQAIHQLHETGRIGEMISFEFNETLSLAHGGYIFGNWRRRVSEAGSHILEKTCHDLDLANWMVGCLPVRVASFGGRRFFTPENAGLADMLEPAPNGRSAFRAWEDPHGVDPFTGGADIMDHQVVILEYANGVLATFHTNAATALPERRFYLCGTEGAIRADVMTGDITLKRIDSSAQMCGANVSDGHGGGDQVMAKHLAETMVSDASSLAGIDEAMHSAIVAFAIDQALESRQAIDLMPMWSRSGINPADAHWS